MLGRIFQSTVRVEDDVLQTMMYGRTIDGRRIELAVEGVEPYFFVPDIPRNRNRRKRQIVREEVDGITIDDQPLRKIVVRYPNQVPQIRGDYKDTYEADVRFIDRVRIDNGIRCLVDIPSNKTVIDISEVKPFESSEDRIKPRIWHIDIETMDCVDTENPEGAVVSICIYDNYLDTYYLFVVGQVNSKAVERMLKSPKWLSENIDSTDDKGVTHEVPPIDSTVKITRCKDEGRLYLKLTQLFGLFTPDIITGWYVRDFDIAYLVSRARKQQYPCPKFNKSVVFDLMQGYAKIIQGREGVLETKKLEFCATKTLKYGKISRKDSIIQLYSDDRELMCAYNIWDVLCTKRIDDVEQALAFFLLMSEYAGCMMEQTLFNSFMIDSFVLNYVKTDTESTGLVRLPSKNREFGEEDIESHGGLVHDPATGIHRNVVVVDLRQEYPSVIRSFNISPETLVDESYEGECYELPSGSRYRKDKRGMLPKILDTITDVRDAIKKEMEQYDKDDPIYKALDGKQFVFKFLMNSFYGVIYSKKDVFRLKDRIMGYDIVDVARRHIMWVKEFIEANTNAIAIYMDTDSVLFEYADEPEFDETLRRSLVLADDLNGAFESFIATMNGDDHVFHIKTEKIYEIFFQSGRMKKGKMVGKKRYAGLISWEGKDMRDLPQKKRTEIKGYEMKRSDSTKLTKRIQSRVFDMILSGDDLMDIRNYIREILDEIKTGALNDEIGIPCGYNKAKYENPPIHIRAAHFSNRHLGTDFRVGSKPIYYYGHIEGKPRYHVFAIDYGESLPEGAVLNLPKMIERTIVNPLSPLIEGLGYTWDGFIEGSFMARQGSLGDFK